MRGGVLSLLWWGEAPERLQHRDEGIDIHLTIGVATLWTRRAVVQRWVTGSAHFEASSITSIGVCRFPCFNLVAFREPRPTKLGLSPLTSHVSLLTPPVHLSFLTVSLFDIKNSRCSPISPHRST